MEKKHDITYKNDKFYRQKQETTLRTIVLFYGTNGYPTVTATNMEITRWR